MAKFVENQPATSSGLTSQPVRDNLDALFQMDQKALRARAQTSPNLTVQVAGDQDVAYVTGNQPLNFAGGNSPAFSGPVSNPVIGVLTIDSNGTLAWTYGTEAATPQEPTIPAGKMPICSVYGRVAMGSIKNTDDSVNGYILKDRRPFVAMPGAQVLLQTQTVTSSVGSVDFTTNINSQFDVYIWELTNVRPTSNGDTFLARVSIGGAFKTDAFYNSAGQNYFLGNNWTTVTFSGFTSMVLGQNLGNDATDFSNLTLKLNGPAGTTRPKIVESVARYDNTLGVCIKWDTLCEYYTSNLAVDGLRFLMATGGIAEGVFSLYGLRK